MATTARTRKRATAAAERLINRELSFLDYDARLLTVAALNGAFQGRADRPVNYVNAPLIAAERGIEVVELRQRSSPVSGSATNRPRLIESAEI